MTSLSGLVRSYILALPVKNLAYLVLAFLVHSSSNSSIASGAKSSIISGLDLLGHEGGAAVRLLRVDKDLVTILKYTVIDTLSHHFCNT